MDLVERALDIILRPREAWPVIGRERSGVRDLYRSYAAILAAIPAAAHFVGMTVIGISFIGIRYRAPFRGALGYAIVSYCLSLLGLYLFALVIDGLASRFDSARSLENAMKLSVYSSTPYWVAGVLFIIPTLASIALLLSLYGFYLLYVGLPVLMNTPVERRPLYFVALVAVRLLISAVASLLTGLFFPQGRMGVI